MSLPESRNETYAPNSQVKSVTLNDIQDVLINLWAGHHGEVTKTINAKGLVHGAGWTSGDTNIVSTGATSAHWAPELAIGARPKTASVQLQGDASADCVFDVLQVHANGTSTNRGATTITNPPAGVTAYPLNFTDFTLATGESVVVRLAPNAANITVVQVQLTFDNPP
jgi:hypothetical protein